MKTNKLLSLLAPSLAISALAVTAACKDDSGLTGGDDEPLPPDAAEIDAPPGVTIVEVEEGDITTDTTWTKDHIYVLKGYVFVTGGTLTIEAGTVIKGSPTVGSALAITKDAKLNAVGTAANPIVFTSGRATPAAGDWGGLVLLGKAPINVTGGTNKIEGFPTSYGERIVYGGTDAAHDCGRLEYARVEYAGFALATDNELNGITLGGCGSATKVDYVQSHLGLDDGVEIFGGTVDVRHLVITQPDDDGLDWDFGWVGTAQFVIIQQKPGVGDKGIEADNNLNNNDLTPRSMPTIWNLTMIGGDGPASAKKQGAMHLRRGTAAHISNAVVAFWNQFAVDVDGISSAGQFGTGLTIKHTYFMKSTNATAIWPTNFDVASGNENDCQTPNTNCFDEAAQIGGDATNHLDVDAQLMAPKDLATPNFKPATGSPVLTGCGTPGTGFDATATFCGAIGATDWTIGWTRFPE